MHNERTLTRTALWAEPLAEAPKQGELHGSYPGGPHWSLWAAARAQGAGVLGFALLLRLCVLVFALVRFGPQWIFTRGLEMGLLGDALAHGRGMSSPFGPPTGPTAMIAPGYPLLIAAIFRVFGSYTTTAALIAVTINLLANLLTVWLIMRVARTLADERAAVIAGSVWACSVPLLWLPTIFWDTSLSCCVLLGAIAAALAMRHGATDRRWLIFGGSCGIAGLLNPALLPCLGVIGAWSAWYGRPRRVRGPLLACVLCMVAYSPWPARNARVFHAWIPTRTTVGLELWMGNHEGSDGYLQENLFPTFNPGELHTYEQQGEVAYTQQKQTQAVQYIRENPARFMHLTLLRVLRFWSGSGSRSGSALFVLHACTTTLLGFSGLLLLFRSGRRATCLLFLLPVCVFPLPYYLTHAEFRYRIVIDPLMTTVGAVALERAICLVRASMRRPQADLTVEAHA